MLASPSSSANLYGTDSGILVRFAPGILSEKEGARSRNVQRLLSMVVLAAMGGLGWLFFTSGPSRWGDSSNTGSRSAPLDSKSGYQPPGKWSHPLPSSIPSNPGNQVSTPGSTQTATGRSMSPADGPTIRIASFNIQNFGKSKASNPAVIRTIAAIIRRFDIVAIQEIRTNNNYLIPDFIKLVNHPIQPGQPGRSYNFAISRRLGDTKAKEQFAFLFDSDRIVIDPQSVYAIDDPDGLLHREPFVATFGTLGVNPNEAFTFTLVTIHTDPARLPEELDAMAEVYRVVRRSGQGEDDIILLGDFNTDDQHLYRLGKIPGIYPLISGIRTNTEQNRQLDNMIIHRPSTTEYTGRAGVLDIVREWNLSEQQALQISDHFPIWAEFSAYERDYAGHISSRRQQRR